MNESELKNILSDHQVPAHSKNAKKHALKLAMAEFDMVQQGAEKKNKNNFQGFSFLSRLIGGTSQNKRKQDMKKRTWIYGGLATTTVAIMVVGLMRPEIEAVRLKTEGGYTLNIMEGITSIESKRGLVRGKESSSVSQLGLSKKEKSVSLPEEEIALVKTDAGNTLATNYSAKPLARNKLRALAMPMVRTERDDHHPQPANADKFKRVEENTIKLVSKDPVSTFSIDVDTASYSYVRKSLNVGRLPPKSAVRIEEMVNYFDYAWPAPLTQKTPFKPTVAVTDSPWTEGNKLIHIGIKGYDMVATEAPRSNLVFLLDVSGSMGEPDKLPLVKNALRMLLDSLQPDDTVGIVVYAGAAGTVLEPTTVKNKAKIMAALDRLSSGGSTAGGQGIKLAYALAEANFDKKAVNRIILATDGDFNVGITDPEELKEFIEHKRKTGVFLSILGFGRGNWNDQLTQALAQNGNGVVAYIDTLSEARKVLVEEASSMLFTIAKDVKIQVEFNPTTVAEYRLVGYETRALKREDFNNDAVDAGDIGAGHTLTAIYEITPVGSSGRKIDDSRYQIAKASKNDSDFKGEYGFLKIRYKLPTSDTSTLITQAITTAQTEISAVVKNETEWASAVATFSQLLKGGTFTGKADYDAVIALAQKSKGKDEFGYRAEFINLVRLAKAVGD